MYTVYTFNLQGADMKLFLINLLFATMACAQMPESNTIEQTESVAAESQTGQRRIELAQTGESCMQDCGYQARSGLYADCLANGGEQKECGKTAREWYRECLQTECSEEEVQLDDCRTDCRAQAKPSFEQCLTENDEQTCRSSKREEIDSCLADCEL